MTTGWQRTVLMGDPTHFSVKGGANPHTRTRWGTRRRVDRARAIEQWKRLRDVLRDLGVRVIVVPPDPKQPGLVYPANAGFMTDLDAEKPLADKRFYLANLLPTRAGEKPRYADVLRAHGVHVASIDERFRMEGEADFFPAGAHYLFTYGAIEKQRFVPSLGFPPWKRVYGFRTDRAASTLLREIVAPKPVIELELMLEAHYHGDTALCAFGPGRRYLLAYREGLTPGGWDGLRDAFGDDLLQLGPDNAALYAANSFHLECSGETFLLVPEGTSETLLEQIRERATTPVLVDVSEFLKKGGGSVKCMIGDLGPVRGEDLGDAGEA